MADFVVIFKANFAGNQYRLCAGQTSAFNIFLTEVIICSFNNNKLQKWTNSKDFNIMASAQFFATQSTPGRFGIRFARFSDEVLR